jgi:hypothetical protein
LERRIWRSFYVTEGAGDREEEGDVVAFLPRSRWRRRRREGKMLPPFTVSGKMEKGQPLGCRLRDREIGREGGRAAVGCWLS